MLSYILYKEFPVLFDLLLWLLMAKAYTEGFIHTVYESLTFELQ